MRGAVSTKRAKESATAADGRDRQAERARRPPSLISTQFETGGSSGECARCSVGPARHAGVCAKMFLIAQSFATFARAKVPRLTAVRIT